MQIQNQKERRMEIMPKNNRDEGQEDCFMLGSLLKSVGKENAISEDKGPL